MAKTLGALRKLWEGDSDRRELIGHFEIVKGEAWASVMKEVDEGKFYYEFIRYFRIGSGYEASVDCRGLDGDAMLRHLLDYLK